MHKYEKIRFELMRRINSRRWPVGTKIPHEEELAAEFGVARGTIRQALSSLVSAGFLEKKRRAGTRVAYPNVYASTLRIPLIKEDIERSGGTYHYRLLRDESERSERRILCLHLSGDTPYQLEDRLIDLKNVPLAASADFSEISPNEWLVQHQPYSSVTTGLSAASPSKADRKYLKLGAAEPVFVMQRQTSLGAQLLTDVRLSHAAGTYSITTESAFA